LGVHASKARSGWAYSLLVWLAMVLYLGPLIIAWNLWDPLDRLPYWICLAVGGAVSVVGFFAWLRFYQPSGWLPAFLLAWAPLLALGLGLGGNVLLDTSPTRAHDTTFLGYSHHQKGPSRARFASWRKPGGEEQVACSTMRRARLCFDFPRSPAVVIVTRQGAFGWEWIESVRPRAPRPE
jgi:hypothetical protein